VTKRVAWQRLCPFGQKTRRLDEVGAMWVAFEATLLEVLEVLGKVHGTVGLWKAVPL
jgi:hypothetical protein